MRYIIPIIALFLLILPLNQGVAQDFAPIAVDDDQVSTNEDTPVSFNVTDNDTDEDTDASINPATVDLDPSTPGLQNSLSPISGNFAVDALGWVTFTPALNFFGPASITYTVNDNMDVTSNIATISVNVVPVNDQPEITGQQLLSTPEDTPVSLSVSNLSVADVDGTTTFQLFVSDGDNYTVSAGNVITPDANYHGPLTVSVHVNDGTINSEPFNLLITVTPVNDQPQITGQQIINTLEDVPVTLNISNLTVSDADGTTTFQLFASGGDNFAVSAGNLITPHANYHGPLTVPVTVSDGSLTSESFNVAITVTPVNDPPVITAAATLTTAEDTPITIQASNLTILDPDHSSGFIVTAIDGTNYSVSGASVTPDLNYNGPLDVVVTVSDGSLSSSTFAVRINVTPVNDAPAITAQATALSTQEDTPLGIQASSLTITDPDNTTGFIVTAIDGANYSVSGNVVTPDQNYFGPLTVAVTVSDGNASSPSFNVSIQVNAVNDPPVIVSQATTLTTPEDTPITLQTSQLNITDPDHATFILSVADGANYSVAGTVITPDPNYHGPLTVPVTISDGSLATESFNMTITVTPVNDAPVITAASTLTTPEDTPITIQPSNLTIVDPDVNPVFTVTAIDGDNYSVSGATVTPDLNYFGPLNVTVRVSDGSINSNNFTVPINVTPVNDAPVITGQTTVSVNEDLPVTLSVSSLIIADPDNSTFTLTVLPGANYTVSGSTVTPALNLTGLLKVKVQVRDGANDSNTFDLEIQVNAVNDTPVITGQSIVSTPEDTPVTVLLSHITISDPDNATFTLFVSPGGNYTLSGNTVTPAANFHGTLFVPIQVSDGTNNSTIFSLNITVTSVNDRPVITGQSPATTLEDTPFTVLPANVAFTDADHTTGFAVVLTDGANYSVSGNIVTPDLNYSGMLTIPLQINDGAGLSDAFQFKLDVQPVNDPPLISGQSALSTNEDTPVVLQLSHLTFTDPDNTSGFILSVNDGPDFSVAGNTVTPDANFHGLLTIPVIVSDGTNNSNIFAFKLQVNPVNDAPTITGQTALSIPEETALTLLASHLVIQDFDNQTSFTVSASAGTNYTLSGNTVTPVQNFNGTLIVPVIVNDGTSNSNSFDLKIQVTPVNDPPVITGQFPLGTAEDEPILIRVTDLQITDPDNSTFTLSLSAGANYTVSGNTVTPAENFNGTLSVPVVVNDGSATSNSFSLQIDVNSVNNEPRITGQQSLTTNEDQAITIVFANLQVTDPDSPYPTGFILNIQNGNNYTVSGTTVTPAPNFFGTLTVPVQVNDGTSSSDDFPLQITVNPVNDLPVITGQSVVTTAEDAALTILLSHLTVSDPDNTYPSQFTLAVQDGTNYSRSGNTITPALNFNGTLSVPVRVYDGAAYSTVFQLQVQVNPVNDAPVISGQISVVTLEDQPLMIQLLHLTVTDTDNTFPTGFSLIVSSGASYTVSGNTITPALNFNGTLSVPVRVNDGVVNSALFNLQVQVTAVNDRPTITGQNAINVPEDGSIAIQLSHLTVTDPDNTYPTGFSLTALPGSNYTLSGNTVTPVANFNGALTVPVRVNDGSLDSDLFNVQVQVTAVNDAPVITGQTFISSLEDQPITIQLAHLVVTDIDNNYPSGFTLTVLPGTGYAASANTVTPQDNFTGTLSVNVRVNDGTANSNTFPLQVQVNAANDIPVISGQNPAISNEDQPFTVLLSHLIVTDPDNSYPTGFTLSVLSGTNYTASGNTVTPALNLTGTISVQVLVNDGQANSNTFNLQLQVNPVNDAPVITGQAAVTSGEDQPLTIVPAHLLVSDPDDTYPGDFTLTVLAGTNFTRSGNTITPVANFTGTLTVPVRVNDGAVNSATFNLQVGIVPVNDPPAITGQISLSTPEDTPITVQLSNLTIVDPDNTSGFTLTVSAGAGYTFSGNTVTPVLNFTGTLTVPVQVSDGALSSNSFDLKIQVQPANDAPVITAQSVVSTLEDTPVTLSLSNLTFTDPDNTSGFTLVVSAGANYTVAGARVTPALNFNGTLTVPVQVNDGTSNSNTFNLQVQVTAVNDVPKITGQQTLTTIEDRAIGIQFSNVTVTDADNTYPAGFTLNVLPGANYEYANGSVIPDRNFHGTLSVPVVVNDGTADSEVFNLQILVTPVNDAPAITGQVAVSVNEDQSVTIQLSHLLVTDPDNNYPTGFTLSVLQGTNYTLTGNSVRPVTNFTGTLTVPVQVSDGNAPSTTFNMQVTVNGVNDAPEITGQVAVATNEEQPLEILLSHLTVTDAESTYPFGFTLTVLSGTSYSFSGNTITPATNFSGTLTVRVRVNDGGANSDIFNLQVVVSPVNDPPVITGQPVVSTPEETAILVQPSHLVIADPDNTSGFTVTVISSGANYTRSGNTVTPDKDFNGTISVPVRVSDGLLNSGQFDLKIQVTPVNDAPSIIGQVLLSTEEDVPITLRVADLTILDPDNTSGFTLTTLAGTNYSRSGNTITPALDFNGTITVSVRVSDGVAQSAVFGVQIQVGDANDPPVITGQSALVMNEDASINLLLSQFAVTDPDNTYPTGFTLHISPGANYAVSGNTVTPIANFYGTLTVPVNVNDGVNNSALFNAKITVNPINDQPSFDAIPNIQVAENADEELIVIQNISKGPLEDNQSLVFFATSNNTTIVGDPVVSYNGVARTADLTYVVKPNVSGVVTITVRAVDNGSPASTFTSTFQVEVMEVNAAPTLQAIANISVAEDSPLREVTLAGITAGLGENQTLTVTVSTDKQDLFDPAPQVVYQSPNTTGVLRLTPKQNAAGIANVSVTVEDNGSNMSPNVNKLTRSFRFTIQPVNDFPEFQSTPVFAAVVGELYEYEIIVSDIESENITFTFPNKPAWLSFSAQGPDRGKLSGNPVSGGQQSITIVATDASGGVSSQAYTLDVNTRPVLHAFNLSITEDQLLTVPVASVFTDADGDAMTEVKFTSLPASGTLKSGNTVVTPSVAIPSSAFAELVYEPAANFTGKDTIRLTARDATHYSLQETYIALNITPVNDAPSITFIESDTLYFEVDGEADFITPQLEAEDPDDAVLTGADITFNRLTYKKDDDVLLFTSTAAIKGTFDPAAGILILEGEASREEYVAALRSIQYNHLRTVDPVVETKIVSFSLTDGKTLGPAKQRLIKLTYSFADLKIPSGFTPNGDQINDVWYIAPPGGELANALVKVFNHRGVTVYESKGFVNPWDGTYGGALLPPGTYFYTIDLKLKNQKTYKGTITILH